MGTDVHRHHPLGRVASPAAAAFLALPVVTIALLQDSTNADSVNGSIDASQDSDEQAMNVEEAKNANRTQIHHVRKVTTESVAGSLPGEDEDDTKGQNEENHTKSRGQLHQKSIKRHPSHLQHSAKTEHSTTGSGVADTNTSPSHGGSTTSSDSFLDDAELWDEQNGLWNDEELNTWLHAEVKQLNGSSSSQQRDVIAEEVWSNKDKHNNTQAASESHDSRYRTNSGSESNDSVVLSSLRGAGSFEQDLTVPLDKKKLKQQIEFGSQEVFEEEIVIPPDHFGKRLKIQVGQGVFHLLLEDDNRNDSASGDKNGGKTTNNSTKNNESNAQDAQRLNTSSPIETAILGLDELINNTALVVDDTDSLSINDPIPPVGFASALGRFEQNHGPLVTLIAVLVGMLVSVLVIGSMILARRAARVETASVLTITADPDAEMHGHEEDEEDENDESEPELHAVSGPNHRVAEGDFETV